MKKIVCLLVALFVLGASPAAFATPEKGWHKGSYFLFGVGSMNSDQDAHVINGPVGSNNVFGYGLTFGWNFLDFLATELQMRYATENIAGSGKEHIANFDFLLKYSLILDSLTRMDKVKFLPYAKAGAGVYGAAVPSATAGESRFGVYGPAGVFAVGMEVLLAKIFYVGAEFTNHFVNLQAKNNAAGTQILVGGFDYQYSGFGYFGVHF